MSGLEDIGVYSLCSLNLLLYSESCCRKEADRIWVHVEQNVHSGNDFHTFTTADWTCECMYGELVSSSAGTMKQLNSLEL